MGWHTGWHMPGREKHEVLKRALHGESRGAPGSTRMVSLSKKDYPCRLSVPTESGSCCSQFLTCASANRSQAANTSPSTSAKWEKGPV